MGKILLFNCICWIYKRHIPLRKNRILRISTLSSLILIFVLTGEGLTAEPHVRDSGDIKLGALIRGYYLNDQRIQWSGLEAAFGADAVVSLWKEEKTHWGRIKAGGEFFLNLPYGKNILRDKERDKYRTNFETNIFEISQLLLHIKKDTLTLRLGKVETPFGKTYYPLFSNSCFDAPFIRTEAILARETGVFILYKLKFFNLDMAIVNGGEDKDTNSSKAFITRLGINGEKEKWVLGISGKIQDGIGSDRQKIYKRHAGIDFMVGYSNFILSGEVIYDEYGCHRDCSSVDGIPRSLYYRDIYYRNKTPITGVGGYIDLSYKKTNWSGNVNYGEYWPQRIGNPYHDDPIRRGIIKLSFNLSPRLQAYGVGLFENERKTEEWRSGEKGIAVMVGLQYLIQHPISP
ncbi:MAG: hypothetical protein HY805_01740 [Nitrospirae bacterium]|nr:hypothetical protein [Nitrospirota bacterium]